MSGGIVGKTFLDRFRVDAYVASGGMGTIFRVWDLERNVPLAMKVLREDLAEDKTNFKRFQREARALKKLAHPNIVPFYGLYQTDDHTFLLESFIQGPTLKQLLRQRKGQSLEIMPTLIYLKGLCAALGYAHAKGVVHCDVKPGNVMIDPGGNVFLTDFGIARHAESTTTTMGTAGSPAYMAPEQIRGEPVTPATDIYALGIMLFEMLTGERPFKGSDPGLEGVANTTGEGLRYAHLNLPVPNPRHINPTIPEELKDVILRALAKEPSQRYQSCQQLFAAVCAAAGESMMDVPARVELSGEIVQPFLVESPAAGISSDTTAAVDGQVQGLAEPGLHRRNRNQALVWVAGLGVVLLAAGALFFSRSPGKIPGGSNGQGAELGNGTSKILQNSTISNSQQGAEEKQTAQILTQQEKRPPTETEEIQLIVPTDTPVPPLKYNQLALVVEKGGTPHLYLYDMNTSEMEQLDGDLGTQWSWAPQWSPDGTRLVFLTAYNNNTYVTVYDFEEDRFEEIYSVGGFSSIDAPAFLPDGERISIKTGANVIILNADTGSEEERFSLPNSRRGFVWNWSNDLLAFSEKSGDLWTVAVSSAPNSSGSAVGSGGENYAPAWSMNGKWLAWQSDEGRGRGMNEIWAQRTDGSDLERLTYSPEGIWSRAPSWSLDGKWIAFVSNQGASFGEGFGELYVVARNGSEINQVTDTGGRIYEWRPAWRP